MFEYFKDNFGWSFMVNKLLAGGAQMDEIDRVCRPLLSQATAATGYEAWIQGWEAEAHRVRALAQRDLAQNNPRGAGRKLLRVALYGIAAEARTRSTDPRRKQNYSAAVAAFEQGVQLLGEPVEVVRVPYEGTTLPGLFVSAGTDDTAPCVVLLNGFDSVKEFLYLSGLPAALRAQGIATLLVDHPGTGGALRLQDLKALAETERPVAAALDFLQAREDVDARRMGIIGISLGGYYAPRAAAFEKRLRCCVAWGAMWDFGQLCRQRVNGGGRGAVYADWLDQFKFVFGDDLDTALATTDRMTLAPVMAQIECPTLVVHGAGDRQVPVEIARRAAQGVTGAPVTLKIFEPAEGGVEHSQSDNMTLAVDAIAHWVAQTLGTAAATRP